uniref:RCK N-terminal domain-containing protein n=1 Tax=Plectus sambesii TaxID=2011161 RepID=A0A914XP95_9BILA
EDAFVDAISWFPLVYWMRGRIANLDNLLRSGVCLADHLVLVKEGYTSDEEHLADCNTIVTVQTIHRLFPSLHVISELTHSSNMRFMQFNAKDAYALHQSKFEKQEKERGSHMSYMFRLPFASGRVFSANMLDTLLYQAFVKDYLVQFVRLLLGIDQDIRSGYLTSFQLTEDDMWIKTYGRLFQKLCSSEADIPIGIFRTIPVDSNTVALDMEQLQHTVISDGRSDEEILLQRRFSSKYVTTESEEIGNNIRNRMDVLGLPHHDYNYTNEARGKVSFVLINPSFDLKLESGDVIYILKPPMIHGVSGGKVNPRRGLRRSRDHSLKMANSSNPNIPSTSQPTGMKLKFGAAPIAKSDSVHSVLDDIPTVVINSSRGEM